MKTEHVTKTGHATLSRWHGFLLFVLLSAILFLAVSVVNIKDKVRSAQTQLYSISKELQQEREKWGELILEKTHLQSPANVDHLAKEVLHMQVKPKEYVKIKIHPSIQLDSTAPLKPSKVDSSRASEVIELD